MRNMLNNKTILITGGTGSFGKKFTEIIFARCKPKKVIIFSRDEFKQHEMAKIFPESKLPIRYFLGDIRDRDRLYHAFKNVNFVVHAAALKQVPALEYNPMEAVKTNVLGADNIVDAAIDRGVEKVIFLSTDKAVNPVNLYGATKLAAEKIFIAANAYGGEKVKFSVVRYGNVMGSRGSVIPYFLNLKAENKGYFPITHKNMTRFWITLEQSADLVRLALQESVGGEIFVPMAPSMSLTNLARAIDASYKLKVIGIREGEKLGEVLISSDEAVHTKIFKGAYVILPQFTLGMAANNKYAKYPSVPHDFVFCSDKNTKWLKAAELKKVIKGISNG